MFAKAVALFFLAAFATALPTPGDNGGNDIVNQCNTGNVQCCNSIQSASSQAVQTLAGLLGIAIQDLTGQVGLGCTPINVIGVTQGASCTQQPVCCDKNQVNGLVNVNCVPISV